MIAPENNDGIFFETSLFQGIECHANLGIDIRGAGKIGVEKSARKVFIDRARFGDALPDSELERGVKPHRSSIFWARSVGARREFFRIIKVPIFFGSHEV